MQDVLRTLTPADYTFVLELLGSGLSLTDTGPLRALLARYEREGTEEARAALDALLEREIRYLGSSDLAYLFRAATGQEPGVSFREVVRDVARTVRVDAPRMGTDREMVEALVQDYATSQFSRLSPKEQQELLESLGVDRDRAASFLKKSAGVFALPLLVQAFGTFVVDGLIKTVIFGTIARVVGKQLAGRLFSLLMARLPWWVTWVGPAAWTLSVGWAVADLQGPAYRKTVPVVLYLGLCSLRERTGAGRGEA